MLRVHTAITMVLLLLPVLSYPSSRHQNSESLLQQADRLYQEKTYGAAADSYERALKTDAVSPSRRDEVNYRFIVALGKAKRWDRALDEGLSFVQQHRGTLWEARGLYWLGRLYMAVPNQGWSVGKRFFRGKDAPQGTFAEKPEFHIVVEQDLRNAEDAMEAARILYPAYRSLSLSMRNEEIQLDYDLSRVLQTDQDLRRWARKRNWPAPADPVWQIDPASAYSRDWAPPKKLMFLFQSAAEVAGDDRHQAALALLGRALWLRQYHTLMHGYAVRWKDDKPHPIPYPYQDATPHDALRELLHNPRYEDESVRDVAWITLASYLIQDNRLTEASHELEQFLLSRPKSPWAVVARRHLTLVQRSEISIGPSEPVQKPGVTAHLHIAYRNADRIHIRIYRLRLQNLYGRHLSNPSSPFAMFQVQQLLGTHRHAADTGPAIASFDLKAAYPHDLAPHHEIVALPLKTAGAYLVEASSDGITASNVVMVSDLALVQKTYQDGALFYAVNSQTGVPVPGAHLITLQSWETDQGEKFARSTGVTESNGLVTIPYVPSAKQYIQVRALAYLGDRYALTGESFPSDTTEEKQALKVYGLTDRAVYRPGQRTHYRLVLMRDLGGQLKPATGVHVQVIIRNPAGNVLLKQRGLCGSFGTLHGDLDLRTDAPLGEYTGTALVAQGLHEGELSAFQFQVEEYKKPEFEVTVAPEPERVQMGEPAAARVTARYYFGGPVPNAHVKYRIFRDIAYSWYRFPRPYDDLYVPSASSNSHRHNFGTPAVEQGEIRTDAHGTARITFHTQDTGQYAGSYDADYTVEVEVQDASRHVVAGSGTVQAVHQRLTVYLEPRRGYTHTGEAVEVDVVGVDPSNHLQPISGIVTVVSDPDRSKQSQNVILRRPLRTDARGKACFIWRPDRAGYYEVAFLTHDSRGKEVKGSTRIWIAGPKLTEGGFHSNSLALIIANPFTTEGQSARALLVTPAPNCTILLTREAGSTLLEKRLVRIPGRALELELPIRRRDAPNITLSATLVRDRKLYTTAAVIYVPPVNQLASVTIHPDRTHYKPGEKATLTLTAHDGRGRPLRSELSLAVSDASLDYIAGNDTPDIQSEFYSGRAGMNWAQASLTSQFTEQVEGLPPISNEGGPDWTLPQGMGQIPDWPGVNGENLDLYPNHNSLQNGEIQWPGNFYGWDPDQPMMGGGGMGGGAFVTSYDEGLSKVNLVAAANAGALVSAPYQGDGGRSPGRDDMNTIRVRRLFADTALWIPAVVTDARGNATVRVTWPDNLTRWRARAVAVGAGGEVGNTDSYVETKKDLLVRLSAPRFGVERDVMTLSASVHNALPHSTRVRVRLTLGSDAAELVTADGGGRSAQRSALGAVSSADCSLSQGSGPNGGVQKLRASPSSPGLPAERVIEVPARGEKRLDWTVRARKAGLLPVMVAARSPQSEDAMEVSLPVLTHGAERIVTQSGVLREQNRVDLAIETPHESPAHDAEVMIHLQPSLAVVALDALPYLLQYPYGCVEQTMSRFLPAVVVRKTLNDLGYDLETLRRRALLSKQAPPNPRVRHIPNSPYTSSSARLDAAPSPPMLLSDGRAANPVFSAARLQAIVKDGLQRISTMQHPDGGWGWWKNDPTDSYMTAYVVYGLLVAQHAGYHIDAKLLQGGLNYLQSEVGAEKDLQRLAFEARILAMDPKSHPIADKLATSKLFDQREKLSIYSRALLAQALHDLGHNNSARVVLRNIEDEAHIDAVAGTATWDETEVWWNWYDDPVETHAAVLQATLAIQPTDPMVPRIVQWLARRREGVRWSTTRETALTVLALADYLRVSKELAPHYTITLNYGGSTLRSYRVTPANALFFDGKVTLNGSAIRAGQGLTIEKSGPGTLYYTVAARSFSQEEPLQAVGGDLAVARHYFRLIPTAPSATLPASTLEATLSHPNPFLTGRYELVAAVGDSAPDADLAYRREPLMEGDSIASGDQIEVELELEAHRDFEYLAFEDIKPAGCEPVDLQSGEDWEPGIYSNRELRDQKVAFFISELPEGRRILTYRLYAETPGQFHVLPTNGYAMYAPLVRALSSELELHITEPADPQAK